MCINAKTKMEKSNYISIELTENEQFNLKSVTSLSVSNHGDTAVTIFGRTLPPMTGQNPARFVIDADSTYTNLDFTVRFETGKGKAFIDYKALNEPNC